jgi:predicted restriction endonuclease
MVEDCKYDKTYDIHRHKPGKEGGKYELGNMFAICPNHHAEITRGLVMVEKLDEKTLRVFDHSCSLTTCV